MIFTVCGLFAALAKQGNKPWARLDALVTDRQYDEAVQLTVDLRYAATNAGGSGDLEARSAVVRKQHSRRRGYLDRLKR